MVIKIPYSLEFFVNKRVLDEVLSKFNDNFKAILVGPNGVGKTFLVRAIANKFNLNFISFDAYFIEEESREEILDKFKRIISSKSLDGKRNLLHITNAEKLFYLDPIIFQKIATFEGIVFFETNSDFVFFSKNKRYIEGIEVIRFFKLTFYELRKILNNLEKLNRVEIPEDIEEKIILNAHGNAHSLINDFNSFLITHSYKFESRNSEDNLFDSIRSLLEGKELGYFLTADEAHNFIIWLNEELPLNMKSKALILALDSLSYVDVLLTRVKEGNWHLLKYINQLINMISYIHPVDKPKLTYKINYNIYFSR